MEQKLPHNSEEWVLSLKGWQALLVLLKDRRALTIKWESKSFSKWNFSQDKHTDQDQAYTPCLGVGLDWKVGLTRGLASENTSTEEANAYSFLPELSSAFQIKNSPRILTLSVGPTELYSFWRIKPKEQFRILYLA